MSESKIVNDAPKLPVGALKSVDASAIVALQRELHRELVSHANAINSLWCNIEDDVEILLPHRSYNGKPIYFQKFAAFAGPNGSPGTPAIVSKAHGISGLDMTGYRVTHFEKYNPGGFGLWERTGTNPYTGNLETVWVDPTNITWHTNYNATALTMTAVLEYQKT